MHCYKDRTFCASQTDNHTCGREMNDQDKRNVEKTGELVSYAKFCEEKLQQKVRVYEYILMNSYIEPKEDNE